MQWLIENHLNIFWTLVAWGGFALAGLMGYNDREIYWVLIPITFVLCSRLMQKNRLEKAQEMIGMPAAPKFTLSAVLESSFIPLIAYLIFYFVF
tara:strand:- start:577 stop:858 length:282 start_codon:yes stop_codon:yes gene_type:complete